MEKGAFEKWFIAQFGALPDPAKKAELAGKRARIDYELHRLNREIELYDRLDQDWRAAMYTFQAAKNDFKC